AVLMSGPKLVLLDEPTAGVNPVMIETMERHIRTRHKEGVTFLIVEHDMQLVMRLCDPVIVLDRGATIATGSPADVQVNPIVLDPYLGGWSGWNASHNAPPDTTTGNPQRGRIGPPLSLGAKGRGRGGVGSGER